MKVAIKTLDGKQFDVEVEAGMLVSQVKEVVQAASPDQSFTVDCQKLIYAGKVLDDAKTVAEFGIVEKGFIVCMLAKPKAAPAAPPANAAAAAASASAPASTAQTVPAPSTAAPPMPQQFGGMDQGEFDDDEDYVEGEEGDEGFEQVAVDPATVASLVAITGSPEEAVVQALAAAYGNADVAAEYLMNGMPEMDEDDDDDEGGFEGMAPSNGGDGFGGLDLMPPGMAPTHNAMSPLEQLRHHPQFNALREVVQTNPSMLQSVIQQIGAQSPEMLAAIQANPAAFLAMLNDPNGAAPPGQSPAVQVPPASLEDAFESAAAPSPPGASAAAAAGPALSASEEASVARLCEMGFPRNSVIEAFVACDRNEEMAANFLFDN